MKDPLDYLSYEPQTGVFRWKQRPGHEGRGKGKVGDVAGCPDDLGYLQLCVAWKRYAGHRLAFLFMTGEMPTGMVDHINGDPSDNRWSNLRLATPEQNAINRRTVSATGFKGVTRHSGGKYQASIKVKGRGIYLGLYATAKEASEAYQTAAKEHFGSFARAIEAR